MHRFAAILILIDNFAEFIETFGGHEEDAGRAGAGAGARGPASWRPSCRAPADRGEAPVASVPEMPLAGEDHRQPAFVGGGDDLFVAHRPARLDDGLDAEAGEELGQLAYMAELIADPARLRRPGPKAACHLAREPRAHALRLHHPGRRQQGAGEEAVARQRLEVVGAGPEVVQVQCGAFGVGDEEGRGARGRHRL